MNTPCTHPSPHLQGSVRDSGFSLKPLSFRQVSPIFPSNRRIRSRRDSREPLSPLNTGFFRLFPAIHP